MIFATPIGINFLYPMEVSARRTTWDWYAGHTLPYRTYRSHKQHLKPSRT